MSKMEFTEELVERKLENQEFIPPASLFHPQGTMYQRHFDRIEHRAKRVTHGCCSSDTLEALSNYQETVE